MQLPVDHIAGPKSIENGFPYRFSAPHWRRPLEEAQQIADGCRHPPLSGLAKNTEFHQKAARARGLSFERARAGFVQLDQFVQNSLAGKRPSDGYFVEFWRLLGEYPEIMAWDRLFDEGKHQLLADVNAAVGREPELYPGLKPGWHGQPYFILRQAL